MSDIYRVKLRPLNHYYFGGENGLGSGDTRNYLVVSRKWPQQTSILGMVRYLLLREKNWLASPGKTIPKEAIAYIGKESFHLGATAEDLNIPMEFGNIERIGPVSLLHAGKRYFPKSLVEDFEIDYRDENVDKESVWYGGETKALLPTVDMKRFKAKNGLCYGLQSFPKSDSGKNISDPFIPESQIGIQKDKKGQSQDQAFYKQTFYRLKADWYFTFSLQVKPGTEIPEKAEIPFGGERCLFSWETESMEAKDEWELSPPIGSNPKNSLLLLSDALVEPQILDHCRFAVYETRDFRFLKTTTTGTQNYAALGEDVEQVVSVKKSHKYNLLKAGSVIYPNDIDKVLTLLNKVRLQQIGYNTFYPQIQP